MDTLLTKLLSGIGVVSVILVVGFFGGYKVKSNAINAYNAKQEVKFASIQSKYDEVSALARSDYLTAFQGVLNQYESSPNINTNGTEHDKLWHLFNRHRIAGQVSKNQPTSRVDESTTQRLENCRLNTIQLLFLQSYINQIKEVQ